MDDSLQPPPRPIEGPHIKKKKKRVGPLTVQEIRWFYKKNSETKYTPFSGYDSISIEFRYRKILNIEIDKKGLEIKKNFIETEDVIVLDGLYKVDTTLTYISPIYWNDESYQICRGTWFIEDDMQPLPNQFAELIEDHHLKNFKDQIIPDKGSGNEKESSKKPFLTSLTCFADEIRWNSVIDIYLYSNPKANKFMRLLTWSKSVQLYRGYNEDAEINDGKPEYTDLMFVVHGIGQKGYENLIAKNTQQMREILNPMIEKQFKECNKKLIMIPIEWRSSLILDNDLSSHILLSRMSSVRESLNSIAMDIMCYQSPLYRTEIINGVIRQLNNVYKIFIKNNPMFKGNISLFAHSLGSVILFDILSNWSPLKIYDEYVSKSLESKLDSLHNEEKESLKNYINARKNMYDKIMVNDLLNEQEENLLFSVKNLFCVGSPLAIFLVMRGAKADSLFLKKERLQRVINIFHPLDPVAYRLEPMFHYLYKYIKPVKLFPSTDERSYNSSYKLPLEMIKSFYKKLKQEKASSCTSNENTIKGDVTDPFGDDFDSDESFDDGTSPRCQSPTTISTIEINPSSNTVVDTEIHKKPWFGKNKHGKDNDKTKETIDSSTLQEELNRIVTQIPLQHQLKYRIDYQIQPTLTEKGYLGMLRGHFSYWTNPDVVSFIGNVLLQQNIDEFGLIEVSMDERLNTKN
ncbi:Phospholipase DDHD1 [Strongyloides ratti]|uniref:Phospholipase DDHD1 n=1 Tax=Strongyloides ratti TaxID=34506 RepID=A0A090LLV8_STRRB|nr:Phospholipase DDHD1 [Strongyloides ratti]CEF70686.1 Phospholipase DDHD1 [Strongyloides ratti]